MNFLILKVYLIVFILLYNSIAECQQWQLSNAKPTYNYLQGVDFVDEDTGFICGYDGEIYKTVDGGNSWFQLKSNTCKHLWSIKFINSNQGFIAGNNGTILKTSDGGGTWNNINTSIITDFFHVYFFDELNGWITGSYNTILRTTNGGNDWEIISHDNETNYTWLNMEFLSPDTGFIAGSDNFFYGDHGLLSRTNDGGLNWESIQIPEEIETIFALDVINKDELWIGAGNQTDKTKGIVCLYYTSNAGKDWDTIVLGANFGTPKRIQFFSDSVGKVLCSNRMFMTNDGGMSWDNLILPSLSSMNDVDWINEQIYFAVGINGCILRFADSGATWKDMKKGGYSSFHDICFKDEQTGFAIGNYIVHPSLYKTSDNGLTWLSYEFDSISYNQRLYSIEFTAENTGWLAGNQGVMFRSQDGGATWQNYEDGYNYMINDLESAGGKYIWAGGQFGKMLKSNNNGGSWKDISLDEEDGHVMELQFLDSLNGYAKLYISETDYSGKLIKTSDGGLTWYEVIYDEGAQNEILSMYFVDINTGYLSVKNMGIVKTTDGGQNWEPLGLISGLDICYLKFFDELNGVAAYSNVFLARTDNGGETWTTEYESPCLADFPNKYYFLIPKEGWIVGNYGRIEKYTGIYTGNNGITSDLGTKNEILFYPNPGDNYIQFDNVSQFNSAYIFNVNGVLVKETKLSGINLIEIIGLKPGLYYVKLYGKGGISNTGKFVKRF